MKPEVFLKKDYPFGSCQHPRAIKIGEYFISASTKIESERLPYPDLAINLTGDIHLSPVWSNSSRIKPWGLYPEICVKWPDFGIIDTNILRWLVQRVCRASRKGKRVMIFCNHGHGRTGTLLACLMAKLEGLDGETAIMEVRRRYCRMAVENKAQECLVAEYARRLRKGKK